MPLAKDCWNMIKGIMEPEALKHISRQTDQAAVNLIDMAVDAAMRTALRVVDKTVGYPPIPNPLPPPPEPPRKHGRPKKLSPEHKQKLRDSWAKRRENKINDKMEQDLAQKLKHPFMPMDEDSDYCKHCHEVREHMLHEGIK